MQKNENLPRKMQDVEKFVTEITCLESKCQQKGDFESNKCKCLENIKWISGDSENSLWYQASQVPNLSGIVMLLSVPGTILDNAIAFAFKAVTYSQQVFSCWA